MFCLSLSFIPWKEVEKLCNEIFMSQTKNGIKKGWKINKIYIFYEFFILIKTLCFKHKSVELTHAYTLCPLLNSRAPRRALSTSLSTMTYNSTTAVSHWTIINRGPTEETKADGKILFHMIILLANGKLKIRLRERRRSRWPLVKWTEQDVVAIFIVI